MFNIPNLFTAANMLCGFVSIILALFGRIDLAPLFILAAVVFDFLDGFIARKMNLQGELGKQLDSLADLVSFGVAPSLIAFQFLRLSLAQDIDGLSASWLQLLPVFILPCAAAYRLARFNISAPSTTGFTGVPVPAVGLLFASFPVIYWYAPMDQAMVTALLLNKWFWYVSVLGASFLMVSTLPMMAFKFNQVSFKKLLPLLILVAVGLVSAICFGWIAVPIVFIAYVVLSLSLKYWYL